MPDLLYEIGTEELPASYIRPALAQMAEMLAQLLDESRLPGGEVITAGTPRRLTVAVRDVPEMQPGKSERVTGPPARIAFDDDGNPTPAALGFARKMGVAPDALELDETSKGAYVAATVEEAGRPAAEVLPELLVQLTAGIRFPKSMHWGVDFTFARPITQLVALFGDQVLPMTIAGVQAGRRTASHPFLAPGELELANADFDAYRDALREHYVLVDAEERREIVRREISAVLESHGSALEDDALVDEVAHMVEFPHAVEGAFEERFLEVPAPVICAAMKGHQRYFPVRDADGQLTARFVTVSNRTAAQDDLVREGNERVLRARLQDARFFWDEDRRRPLDELVPRLADVVFLGGLGDNLQRTDRLVALAGQIADAIGDGVDAEHVRRAARLCKADLLTGLVGEFASLQGVIGQEIALATDQPAPVALAIAEHYRPAGADDALPDSLEGCTLALADRLDVITGCFALGLLPTGSQDPYALRRGALGILLIIEQKGLDLDVMALVGMARELIVAQGVDCDDSTVAKIGEFFRDRLYHTAIDRGFRHDFVRAVLAQGFANVKSFWARLTALADCAGEVWWKDLVTIVDRTYRIQRDVDQILPVRDDLLTEPAEQQLAATLDESQDGVSSLFADAEYMSAAELYCYTFGPPVTEFFDNVFVNTDDEAVRLNRKSLVGWVYQLFAHNFADLYLIEDVDE